MRVVFVGELAASSGGIRHEMDQGRILRFASSGSTSIQIGEIRAVRPHRRIRGCPRTHDPDPFRLSLPQGLESSRRLEAVRDDTE